MVVSQQVEQAVEQESQQLFVKIRAVVLRLSERLRDRYHYIAQKQMRARRNAFPHGKGKYIRCLFFSAVLRVEALHRRIVYENNAEFSCVQS